MSSRPGGVTQQDVARITSKLFLTEGAERSRKSSAFWMLLALSAVISGAGVVADSVATVIGAMIVAPLMTPIIGTALAIVLADRRQMLDNLLIVLGGAALVVAIGFLLGVTHQADVLAATNDQVSGRVSPRLIDLLAALATGVVGAFALVRSDVSDTLPGVAIAISLVPPLSVVGLTLESGAPAEAWGALLLFGTNVTAIIATGTVVLLLYRLREVARGSGLEVGQLSARTLAVVAGMLVVVSVPLGVGSWRVFQEERLIARAHPVASAWAAENDWRVNELAYRQDVLNVVVLGQLPLADTGELRTALDDAGLRDVHVRVTLVLGGSRDLPAESAGESQP